MGKKTVLSALMLAMLFMLPAAWLRADELSQDEPAEKVDVDCRECHWDVYLIWEQSAHGRGLSCGQCHLSSEEDHARQGHGAQGGAKACMSCHTTGYDAETDTWEEDNVHCHACHTPVSENHPEDPMPVNRSDGLCGQCHIQARFEWQESAHGMAGVSCVSCHSQHATGLKSATISDQCAICHEGRTEGYSHSIHSDAGLSCANCHLAPLTGPVGEGSARRNHSFHVAVETCVACHEQGLHDYPMAANETTAITFLPSPPETIDSMASSIAFAVSAEPPEANPLGFVAVGSVAAGVGIGGVVVGLLLVLFPWARSRRRRPTR